MYSARLLGAHAGPRTHITTLVVLILAASLWSRPLFARQKTDVIVMANGDRLTCEIKKLEAGVLYVSLDYVDGTISIAWSKVQRLESKQLFAVQTDSGATYTGTLKTVAGPEDQPRSIEIAEPQPQRASMGEQTVEQTKVVAAQQYGESFWPRLHGNLGVGLTYNKSNGTTQFNLQSGLDYRRERIALQLDYNSTFSNAAGSVETTRNQVDVEALRLLRWDNWYY